MKEIRCKNCRTKGVPRNNSSIGFYCDKPKCSEAKIAKAKSGSSKVRQQINKVSKKLSKEQSIYRGKRIIFLAEKPYCKAALKGCTGIATTVHHTKGRIGLLLNDVTFWVGLCINCHKWVEEHPKEAKELGLSKDRLCKE